MQTKELPGYMVSLAVSAIGAYFTHIKPEWGPAFLGLVACFTHHTGKEVGKKSATNP
jgi:hypothetical protein